jgi:ribonuclease-3
MKFLDRDIIKKIDNDILLEALTHSSYSNEHKESNNYERLEFLGDAVLELVTSEYFYLNTNYKEGEMTKKRASFVCEKALAHYAKELGIPEHIRVGHGQEGNINETIIADVFESILGAIYLTQGFNVVKEFINEIIVPYIEKDFIFFGDYKTLLQEYVQTDKKSLEYVLTNEYGEAHNKTFEVEVKINDIVYGKGIGKSKKEAEQNAAFDAYKKSAK